MKTSLLAVIALFAMSLSVHATEIAPVQDELRPADELAAMDGLDVNPIDESAEMDLYIFPPHHPHPPHPGHPHPHPHPVPPPRWWYECTSSDRFNNLFIGRGTNPVQTQRRIHNRCEYDSQGYCYDNGCRRI